MRYAHSDPADRLSSARQYMLRACLAGTAAERQHAVDRWDALADMEDLDFGSSRLVPYFYYRNRQEGIFSRHDSRLKIIYKHWWLRMQHIRHQLESVHAALLAADIDVVVIKGASLMRLYEQMEHRPMADFDLLVRPEDLHRALGVIRECNYTPSRVAEELLKDRYGWQLEFNHAIACVHPLSGTKIDLHWRIGSQCSRRFSESLWQHLEPYPLFHGARRPQLAFEIFMLVIHAVHPDSRDNLNWILDMHLIGGAADTACWQEARRLAVSEKKEDLFDYGCGILKKFGLYAPASATCVKPRSIVSTSQADRQGMGVFRLHYQRIRNILHTVDRLYPHARFPGKVFKMIRVFRFNLLLRRDEGRKGSC